MGNKEHHRRDRHRDESRYEWKVRLEGERNERRARHGNPEGRSTMANYYQAPKKLYRSRHGRIFGVCRGFADYMEVRPGVIRILTVIAAFLTGFWMIVGAYIVLSLVLKPEPVLPLESEEDAEFYNSYSGSREMAIQRIKRVYDSLDRRIQRMEAIVTARDYDWDRRLNEGR